MSGLIPKEESCGDGVFELLTVLCEKECSKCPNIAPKKNLANRMRCNAYEIILKKSSRDIPSDSQDAVTALLTYYLLSQKIVKNVVDFKNNVELKKAISTIRCSDYGEEQEIFNKVLKLLVALAGTVQHDSSTKIFQNPFTFGLLDKMLPRPPRLSFGSPNPYPCYPASVFQLPYALKKEAKMLENCSSKPSTHISIESFYSKMRLDSSAKSNNQPSTFLGSLPSTTTNISYNSENTSLFNFGRLTGPRDLIIPKSVDRKVIITLPETAEGSVEEVYIAKTDQPTKSSMDIWEIATQIDKNLPKDLWDLVAKLPPLKDRQLIATSSREMQIWKQTYSNQLTELSVISEKQFIRHVMYLLIGIETSSFPFNKEANCFQMRADLVLEGISKEVLIGYVLNLLLIGTYYRRLYNSAFNQSLEDQFNSKGLVYEAGREVIRRYLLQFRMKISEMYDEQSFSNEHITLPTLMQILFKVEPLKYEIETIVSIFKLMDTESESSLPVGAELMSYMFNEISLVTNVKTALTMFSALFSICKVYFKFIEKFIFEGELNDQYHEFFIRKDSNYVNCRSKRYWDKGFHITKSVAVPEFLRSLAKLILLCGKSLRLLKLCNPSDPLILLISSDHPSVKSCSNFDKLEQQQQLLDVYRTRCLFVSGEPVTFDQILLKKEADRKAFTEMASLKQAETMEKIVAERKRLAQLIIAEKQHSLRVLEAAMAEAKAAKMNSKNREKRLLVLEQAADKAAEEVDSKLKEDERHKMLQYYSKLNMEVEKSKIHSEWKIKRLQLDQSRIQLLSTEERNFRREKLELQQKQNEEVMAMSIQSIDTNAEEKSENEMDKSVESFEEAVETKTESTEQENPLLTQQKQTTSEYDANKLKNKKSNEVFTAFCNVAKTIFGVSSKNCDNDKELDLQGNIIPAVSDIEINSNEPKSSESDFEDAFDNDQFFITRQEAVMNKKKVMAHEFGRIDNENNTLPSLGVDEENNLKDRTSCFTEAKKNKLKVLGTEYNLAPMKILQVIPKTDAQKEALINKHKVLGVEYNLPALDPIVKEPMNIAQEEAVKNKQKVLKGEFDPAICMEKKQQVKRSNLTLNLKPFSDTAVASTVGVTPNIGATTPADFFPRLDLETPTTAEVPFEGGTGDVFSPRSDAIKDDESEESKHDKKLSNEGFDFTIMVDEDNIDNEIVDLYTPQNSPVKHTEINKHNLKTKYSFFNILEGTYSLEDFDPFGVKALHKFSTFTNQMDSDMNGSVYSHPAHIMAEVKKRPYENIFIRNSPHLGFVKNDDEQEITSDNIATLTACLQRSVMLPLTYQLEVVNNSILTYFLVNLDMYEHMRSMKDYFFLMDGEFSRSICHNLFNKLGKTLNPDELLNFATLHNILDKALGSSISHIHKFSENLSFTISDTPLSFHHSSPDVLQCLSLTYTVSWPLNIILSQEALTRYAKVFQFLIKMRRVSWVLSEGFESLKLTAKLTKEHSRTLIRSPQYISIQIYRHNMASLIRSLDNYIVTTCILSSWTEYEKDLKKARTLDDLYECHVVYIKKVLFRCLLNNRSTPVMKLLNDIFTVILKFTRVLKAGEWQQKELSGEFTNSNHVQLLELYNLFEKLAKYLHKVITKLTECGYQRHLVELLTLINLNQYYDADRSKDETNTSSLSMV